MTNLTNNEVRALQGIIDSEYMDGREGAEAIACSLENPEACESCQ